jgi:hypothetical protein
MRKDTAEYGKVGKRIPIVAIFSVLLLVGGVGAALYLMFSGQATVQVRVKGVDGQAIQAGSHGAYDIKAPLATLEDQMYGAGNADTYAEDCALLSINTYDLDSEDLLLSITVYDGDPEVDGVEVDGWTASPEFVEFCYVGGDGQIFSDGAPTDNGDDTWTISNAQIEDMVHKTPPATQENDENCLLISFNFDDLYGSNYGSVTWYVGIEISVDNGA